MTDDWQTHGGIRGADCASCFQRHLKSEGWKTNEEFKGPLCEI